MDQRVLTDLSRWQDRFRIHRRPLANPYWPYLAAKELGIEDAAWKTLPPPYAHGCLRYDNRRAVWECIYRCSRSNSVQSTDTLSLFESRPFFIQGREDAKCRSIYFSKQSSMVFQRNGQGLDAIVPLRFHLGCRLVNHGMKRGLR